MKKHASSRFNYSSLIRLEIQTILYKPIFASFEKIPAPLITPCSS